MDVCTVVALYGLMLDREPGVAATEYWVGFPAEVVAVEVARSPESQWLWPGDPMLAGQSIEWSSQPTGLLELVGRAAEKGCGSPGWVPLGHGLSGPAELLPIRVCESGGDYRAANPRSSARGGWQFLSSTWEATTGARAPASLYAPVLQDAAAIELATEVSLSQWSCHR